MTLGSNRVVSPHSAASRGNGIPRPETNGLVRDRYLGCHLAETAQPTARDPANTAYFASLREISASRQNVWWRRTDFELRARHAVLSNGSHVTTAGDSQLGWWNSNPSLGKVEPVSGRLSPYARGNGISEPESRGPKRHNCALLRTRDARPNALSDGNVVGIREYSLVLTTYESGWWAREEHPASSPSLDLPSACGRKGDECPP